MTWESAAAAATVVAALLAAAACLRAARLASPRGAFGWRCQAAALAVVAVRAPLGAPPGVGAPAAVLEAAAALLVLAGMWATSRTADPRARARVLLDAGVGAVAGATAAHALVLDEAWDALPHHDAVLLLRPTVPLFLGLLYLLIAVTEIPPRRWPMPLLVGAALVALTVAEVARGHRVLTGTDAAAWVVQAGWPVCCVLWAGAALVYRGTSPRRDTRSTARLVAAVPNVLLLPAFAALLARRSAQGRLDSPEVGAVVLLLVLVAVRQSLTLAENRALVQRLTRSQAELRHRAAHDDLTGLPNRAALHERLGDALGRGPVGVLVVDLDGFKRVNDELGHEAGDALLVQVAQRLRAAVPEAGTPARLGGDEFAVVVPGRAALVEEVADRVVAALGAPYAVRGAAVDHVGASVGAACTGAPGERGGRAAGEHAGNLAGEHPGEHAGNLAGEHLGEHAEELLRRADGAMYAAKRDGGSCATTSGRRRAG
ncbi:diguanylate cyclase domain-containing protein [Kineococcus gypseus]|uniref:diguanylate cyclase domain-containing protein n=1 Tax=Kineococcus gypseus TaxID=1637102 RepID=UPI003D7E03FB